LVIVEVLEIRRGKSPLIIEDLDPHHPQPATRRAAPTPHSTVKPLNPVRFTTTDPAND